MAGTWDEVSASPEFNALPIEQKTAVRNEFFDREIAPRAPKEHLEEVRKEFARRTDETLKRYEMLGGVKSRPDAIQDSGEYWIEQAVKGVSQTPEFSATGADFLLNSFPGRIIEALRAAVTGTPIQKSDMAGDFRKAERGLGIIKDIPATTDLQRAFGKATEFAVASAPFSLLNIAGTTGRKSVAALIEALSTAGGAGGATIGESAGRDIGGSTGAAIGALGGGLAGGGISAIAVPKAAERGAEGAAAGIKRMFQIGTGGRKLTEDQLEEILGPKLANILKSDPAAAKRLAESTEVAKVIPNFTPDLASATGSKVIGAMKERVSREGPDILSRFNYLTEKNKESLEKFRAASFPKGGDRPQDLARVKVESDLSVLESASKRVHDDLDKQIKETDRLIDDYTRAHERAPSNAEIGDQLIALQKEARELRYAAAQAEYLPVYQLADQMGFTADIGPIVQDVRKAMQDTINPIKRDQYPSAWNAIIDFVRKKEKRITQKVMETVYKGAVPDSITQFIARNGGLSKASLSGEFKDMERLPKGLFKPTMTNLVRTAPNAKTADEMRMALIQAKYLPEDADINTMYRMIQEEFNDGKPLHFSMLDEDAANSLIAAKQADIGQEIFELQRQSRSDVVPVSFREFHEIVKRVNRDLENPGRAGENLTALKKKLDAQLNQYDDAAGVGEALKKANQFWADQFKEPFVKGAGGAMQKGRVQSEDIVEKLFLAKRERGAQDWKRIYGDNPEAAQLLYQGASDSFLKAAVGGGTSLNLGKAKTWMNRYDGFLKEFPALRAEFDGVIRGVESASAEGAERVSKLQESLKRINDAKKETERGALARVAGIENTRAVAQRAIASPEEMDAVLRLVRSNPAARQGFATELAETVLAHGNPEAYLLSHSDSLKKGFDALGPDHWKNLQAIVKGEQIMQRGGDPSRLAQTGVGGDPIQEVFGTSSSGVFSIMKGLGSWVSPEYAVFHLGGRYIFKVRRDQERAFLVELMTNPELASKLAKSYENMTPETAEQIAKGLYTQGSREAKEAFREAWEEIQPMLRLHGIRVTVNAANVPGREEFRKNAEEESRRAAQQGVKSMGDSRLRRLQGDFAR